MFWLKKSTPAKPSGRIWSLLRPKQSRAPWKHHPVALPFTWQTTKPPQTRAEDARKIQQQLEKHPHIWIWKAEQPKSVNPLNSALVFPRWNVNFFVGWMRLVEFLVCVFVLIHLLFWNKEISINVYLAKLEETSVGLNKTYFNFGGIFLVDNWLFLLIFCFLHFQRCVNVFLYFTFPMSLPFYKLPATLKFGHLYTCIFILILYKCLYLNKIL